MSRIRRMMSMTIVVGACAAGVYAYQDQPVKPDNSRANQDTSQNADQTMTKSDRDLARQIRKSVVDDKSLSTYAHNVKILSHDGTVTLRGPVRSEEEKAAIEAKAKSIAGVSAVNNELTVAPNKNNQ